MSRKSLKYAILLVPFLLAACGEGYEPVRTDAFPYGNQRTAGTGVAYVLAKMLPERELNLEQATPPPPAVEPESAPESEPAPEEEAPAASEPVVQDENSLEKLFDEALKK